MNCYHSQLLGVSARLGVRALASSLVVVAWRSFTELAQQRELAAPRWSSTVTTAVVRASGEPGQTYFRGEPALVSIARSFSKSISGLPLEPSPCVCVYANVSTTQRWRLIPQTQADKLDQNWLMTFGRLAT